MKKVLFLLLSAFVSVASTAQDYTSFMGIKMNAPTQVFGKALIEKGMSIQKQSVSDGDFVHVYVGDLDGSKNCTVIISENAEKASVNNIGVSLFSESNDTTGVKRNFLNEYKRLEEKYGKPLLADEDKTITPRFTFQNFLVWFNEYRTLLSIEDLGNGKAGYFVTTTYYPKPVK